MNFKKWMYVLAALIGAYVYVSNHYGYREVLELAKKKNDPELTPKVEYYVGMAHYLRDEMPLSAEAFEMVLANPSTGYYTPKAIYRLGMVYSERRQWDQARGMYNRYMEEYPEGDNIDSVRKKFEVIKFR